MSRVAPKYLKSSLASWFRFVTVIAFLYFGTLLLTPAETQGQSIIYPAIGLRPYRTILTVVFIGGYLGIAYLSARREGKLGRATLGLAIGVGWILFLAVAANMRLENSVNPLGSYHFYGRVYYVVEPRNELSPTFRIGYECDPLGILCQAHRRTIRQSDW